MSAFIAFPVSGKYQGWSKTDQTGRTPSNAGKDFICDVLIPDPLSSALAAWSPTVLGGQCGVAGAFAKIIENPQPVHVIVLDNRNHGAALACAPKEWEGVL